MKYEVSQLPVALAGRMNVDWRFEVYVAHGNATRFILTIPQNQPLVDVNAALHSD